MSYGLFIEGSPRPMVRVRLGSVFVVGRQTKVIQERLEWLDGIRCGFRV